MSRGPPANLPPAFRPRQMIMSLWVPQVVHAAAELGVADILAEVRLQRGSQQHDDQRGSLLPGQGPVRELSRVAIS